MSADPTMPFAAYSATYALLLLAGMILFLEAGRRIGRRLAGKEGAGGGAVDAAIFGVLGLLVAFTFSGAAARFDERRHLIIEEANAIGTAYLRLDLLAAPARDELRELMRRYLDARLKVYRMLPDIAAARAEVPHVGELQRQIWTRAVAATGAQPGTVAGMLLLPALNETFDIATTRIAVTDIHPPPIIFAMLALLSLMSALLAGLGMATQRKHDWVRVSAFPLVMAVTYLVILDLEYPRRGFIRLDASDRILIELRQSMEP